MPILITQDDFTRWYNKINVLRKQTGIGAATIAETSANKTNAVNNANRMITVINNINTARGLHSLLQQTAGTVSSENVETNKVSLEATVNDINTKLHALLRTCINVQNTTIVPQGCNQTSGNSLSSCSTNSTYSQTSACKTNDTYTQTATNNTYTQTTGSTVRQTYGQTSGGLSYSTNSTNSNSGCSTYNQTANSKCTTYQESGTVDTTNSNCTNNSTNSATAARYWVSITYSTQVTHWYDGKQTDSNTSYVRDAVQCSDCSTYSQNSNCQTKSSSMANQTNSATACSNCYTCSQSCSTNKTYDNSGSTSSNNTYTQTTGSQSNKTFTNTSSNSTNTTNSFTDSNKTCSTNSNTSYGQCTNLSYDQSPATYNAINHYSDEEADNRE